MQRFFKYHALGNDFVVLDRRAGGGDLSPAESIAWCDRHFGVGADGVLVVLSEPGTDGRMVVHNADGSVAEMCGNGIRCVARFLAEQGGGRPSSLKIATGAGTLTNALEWEGERLKSVTVEMGPAKLSDRNLPPGPGGRFYDQDVGGVIGTALSMGNPHLVLLDTPPERAPELGAKLERHPLFPERTNVEFCAPRAKGGLTVRVWERGVGLTLACGTGACAAVAAHALHGRVPFEQWVPVELPGGLLEIRVAKDLSQVLLKGPATLVYQGER